MSRHPRVIASCSRLGTMLNDMGSYKERGEYDLKRKGEQRKRDEDQISQHQSLSMQDEMKNHLDTGTKQHILPHGAPLMRKDFETTPMPMCWRCIRPHETLTKIDPDGYCFATLHGVQQRMCRSTCGLSLVQPLPESMVMHRDVVQDSKSV